MNIESIFYLRAFQFVNVARLWTYVCSRLDSFIGMYMRLYVPLPRFSWGMSRAFLENGRAAQSFDLSCNRHFPRAEPPWNSPVNSLRPFVSFATALADSCFPKSIDVRHRREIEFLPLHDACLLLSFGAIA